MKDKVFHPKFTQQNGFDLNQNQKKRLFSDKLRRRNSTMNNNNILNINVIE